MSENSSIHKELTTDIGDKFLDFVLTAYGVKLLPRTGWVRNGITGTSVEHVGDHMWGMALMSTLLLSDSKDVDVFHVVQLCIIHDLAESIVGDLTPYCGVSKEEKAVREKEAIAKLASTLPESLGIRLCALFDEFEEKTTPEAIVAQDMDKLDMVLQANLYEKRSLGRDLSEFFKATANLTTDNKSLLPAQQRLASLADAIARRRSDQISNNHVNSV